MLARAVPEERTELKHPLGGPERREPDQAAEVLLESMLCNRAEPTTEKKAAVLLVWSSLPQKSHALRPVETA